MPWNSTPSGPPYPKWLLLPRLGLALGLLGASIWLHGRYGGEWNTSSSILLALMVVALVTGLALAFFPPGTRYPSLFSYLQVLSDTVFITGVVVFTGGLQSPFPVFYNLVIIHAAMFLPPPGALLTAAGSALAYGGTMDLLYYGLWPQAFLPPNPTTASFPSEAGLSLVIRLVANVASFFLIALLGSYLAQRLSQAESRLAEENQALDRMASLYREVVQNLESGLVVTDPAGRVEYINALAEQILGMNSALVQGKELSLVLPDLLPLENGGPYVVHNGSHQTLQITSSTVMDAHNHPAGTLYLIQDLSGMQTLEKGLKEVEELERLTVLDTEKDPLPESFAGLVGRSPAMEKVYHLIDKMAESPSTVLIMGESGTGKELVARAIHEKGPRRGKPFVAVNCAALPEGLMESELFGHVRGAFTGATTDRLGFFREAHGGTILLDEIGDLPLSLQAKLLRVLQDHVVIPVGSSRGVPVDVRVLAATNKNLKEEVAQGRFREDLYYRIHVVTIILPPLRERKEDLPLLLRFLLQRFSASSGKPLTRISSPALRLLLTYPYPGNVRELENIIRHAAVMAEGQVIEVRDLPPYLLSEESKARDAQGDLSLGGISLDAELERYEKRLLKAALEKAGGVQKKAAEILGINYRSLRHRLHKYQMGS